MYKCKFCSAEIPEASGICPKCGYDNKTNTRQIQNESNEMCRNDAFDSGSWELKLEPSDSLEDVLAKYKTGAELYPDDDSYPCCIGEILQDLGRYEDAAAEYRKAVKLDPDDRIYHFALGVALQELGFSEEAMKEKTRAMEIVCCLRVDDFWPAREQFQEEMSGKRNNCTEEIPGANNI